MQSPNQMDFSSASHFHENQKLKTTQKIPNLNITAGGQSIDGENDPNQSMQSYASRFKQQRAYSIVSNKTLLLSQKQHQQNPQFQKNVKKIRAVQEGLRNAKNSEDIYKFFQDYEVQNPEIFTIQDILNLNNLRLKKYKQSVYFGGMDADKKRKGKGIMLYYTGRIYEGEWESDLKQGRGFEIYSNAAIYEGDYINNKPHGHGRYVWSNGESYDGEWVKGQKHGSGMWKGMQGDSYIGEWKDGNADGYGVHQWINGDKYEGQFKQSLKHGKGTEHFKNGDTYTGEYLNGRPHGQGVYKWVNGSTYKGTFKEGLRHGKGVWRKSQDKNSEVYEGEYSMDKKEGHGTFTWNSGNQYTGEFLDNLRHGYGEMKWIDGSVYKGEWDKGFQNGEGELLIPGEPPQQGIFFNNCFQGEDDTKQNYNSNSQDDFMPDKVNQDQHPLKPQQNNQTFDQHYKSVDISVAPAYSNQKKIPQIDEEEKMQSSFIKISQNEIGENKEEDTKNIIDENNNNKTISKSVKKPPPSEQMEESNFIKNKERPEKSENDLLYEQQKLEEEQEKIRENQRQEQILLLQKEKKEKEEKEKQEKLQKEKEEKERLEKEERERAQKEQEEKEKLEQEKKQQEEKEKLEKLQQEKEKQEQEEKEKLEKEKLEKEKQEQEEKERLEKEEQERLEKEEKERQDKLQQEKKEQEEKDRKEKEEMEKQLFQQEKMELEKEKQLLLQRQQQSEEEEKAKQLKVEEELKRLEKERQKMERIVMQMEDQLSHLYREQLKQQENQKQNQQQQQFENQKEKLERAQKSQTPKLDDSKVMESLTGKDDYNNHQNLESQVMGGHQNQMVQTEKFLKRPKSKQIPQKNLINCKSTQTSQVFNPEEESQLFEQQQRNDPSLNTTQRLNSTFNKFAQCNFLKSNKVLEGSRINESQANITSDGHLDPNMDNLVLETQRSEQEDKQDSQKLLQTQQSQKSQQLKQSQPAENQKNSKIVNTKKDQASQVDNLTEQQQSQLQQDNQDQNDSRITQKSHISQSTQGRQLLNELENMEQKQNQRESAHVNNNQKLNLLNQELKSQSIILPKDQNTPSSKKMQGLKAQLSPKSSQQISALNFNTKSNNYLNDDVSPSKFKKQKNQNEENDDKKSENSDEVPYNPKSFQELKSKATSKQSIRQKKSQLNFSIRSSQSQKSQNNKIVNKNIDENLSVNHIKLDQNILNRRKSLNSHHSQTPSHQNSKQQQNHINSKYMSQNGHYGQNSKSRMVTTDQPPKQYTGQKNSSQIRNSLSLVSSAKSSGQKPPLKNNLLDQSGRYSIKTGINNNLIKNKQNDNFYQYIDNMEKQNANKSQVSQNSQNYRKYTSQNQSIYNPQQSYMESPYAQNFQQHNSQSDVDGKKQPKKMQRNQTIGTGRKMKTKLRSVTNHNDITHISNIDQNRFLMPCLKQKQGEPKANNVLQKHELILWSRKMRDLSPADLRKFRGLRQQDTIEKIRKIINPPRWIPGNTQDKTREQLNKKYLNPFGGDQQEYQILKNIQQNSSVNSRDYYFSNLLSEKSKNSNPKKNLKNKVKSFQSDQKHLLENYMHKQNFSNEEENYNQDEDQEQESHEYNSQELNSKQFQSPINNRNNNNIHFNSEQQQYVNDQY